MSKTIKIKLKFASKYDEPNNRVGFIKYKLINLLEITKASKIILPKNNHTL